MGVTFGVVLIVLRGGRGEVKLKLGKAEMLMGSEMVGRSGASATSCSSGCFDDGRVVVRSLFILPPPELTLLAAGVLERG